MKRIETGIDHITAHEAGSICSPEEMLLFDIETTGLSKERTQLYLIGCAFHDGTTWQMKQWLTENAGDERDVLEEFLSFASGYQTLVTFNGERFDIPYLQYKADYYGLDDTLGSMKSFDIYAECKIARNLLGLASMSQRSLEVFLRIDREDQLDGGRLIPVYYEYEKSRSQQLEHLLLLHNADDIRGMLQILPILSYAGLLRGGFSFAGIEEDEQNCFLHYSLDCSVPVAIHAEGVIRKKPVPLFFRAEADEGYLLLSVPVIRGTGRYMLENISEYYYLPEEDRVIHRDVAQFLPRSRRVRATRKTCFIKKEGRFLPLPKPLPETGYSMENDPKGCYADLDDLKNSFGREQMVRLGQMYLECFL